MKEGKKMKKVRLFVTMDDGRIVAERVVCESDMTLILSALLWFDAAQVVGVSVADLAAYVRRVIVLHEGSARINRREALVMSVALRRGARLLDASGIAEGLACLLCECIDAGSAFSPVTC